MKISYFVSPHGFGHAARASAVMAALKRIIPSCRFQILTTVPEHFFRSSGIDDFNYECVKCDVGLIQRGPTQEDLPKTVLALEKFLLFKELPKAEMAISSFKPSLIICDISPLGLKLGKELGIPTLLIENFTWDWIYEGYLDHEPRLESSISTLKPLFEGADFRIQMKPICRPVKGAPVVEPISRPLRSEWQRPELIRPNEKYILISMGGVSAEYNFIEKLFSASDLTFVMAGSKTERIENIIRFANNDEDFYHPNLVAESSVVVSKAGVSTVSEVYWGNVPFMVVSRPLFRESKVVIDFIKTQNLVKEITQEEFDSGNWVERIADLVKGQSSAARVSENGASQAAKLIHSFLVK